MGHPERQRKSRGLKTWNPEEPPAFKEIDKMREWNLGGQRWRIFKEGKSSRKKCLLKS